MMNLRSKAPVLAIIMLLMVSRAFGGAIDIVFSNSFGTENTKVPGSFNYPTGIAVNSATGDVFVLDELFGRIQRFDAAGNYITEWAESGGINLAVDIADGSVYLANSARNKVTKYSPTGQILLEWGISGSGPGQFAAPKDVAVNPLTRDVYVADSENRRVQEFTSNGVYVRQFTDSSLRLVYGVAVDPTGQFIYVSDAGAVRMHKFDANGTHLLAWSSIGNDPGQLRWPRDVAVAPNGDVIVASTDNNELVRFDANGNYLQTIQGPNVAGTGLGGFHARSVTVNQLTGEIYAPASYANRIDRFDSAGNYLSSWGFSDTTGSHLNRPKGVAIDPNTGDIFVADDWNNKFKRFSSDGTFEMEWGTGLDCSIWSDETTVNFPSRIAIDAMGNVWTLNGATYYPDDLARWSNKYVRLYDTNGNHVLSFGGGVLKSVLGGLAVDPIANEVYVVNTPYNKIDVFNYGGTLLREFGTQGMGPGEFQSPAGIAVDPVHHTLFVIDSGNQRIQKLDTNGNFLLSFGSAGSANGQFSFSSLSNLGLDNYDHVLVADTYNSRIQVFDLDGHFLMSFGSIGNGNDSFRFPDAVTASGAKIAVADTYHQQIKVFNIIPLPDQDNDNVADSRDNCPVTANLDQADQDNDGIGDLCDNCAATSNASQTDTDGDGIGDACDPDADNDGLSNTFELSIGTNPFAADSDGDGISDYDEVAFDGDPSTYTPGADLNPLTNDTDGDGYLDGSDSTPLVFNSDTVWIDDAVPAGAVTYGTWTFVSSNPTPYSGAVAHQDTLATGTHQHYFRNATSTLDVDSGDILFAYVYLDPANPPSEVMLQWREGSSWEHRAYFGANSIDWGVNGAASRYHAGPLPVAGGWVRLEVPAKLVGLEGRTVNGMAFTLYNGRATWDYAGKSKVPLIPQLQFSASSYETSEGSGAATLTVTRLGKTSAALSISYATADGTATAGSDYTTTTGTLSFAAGEASKTITVPIVDDTVAEGTETLTVTLSNAVNATIGNRATATVNIADNDFSISGHATVAGSPLSGVRFTATNGGACSPSDSNGVYHCTVPVGWSGDVISALAGYSFNPAWREYSNVSADIPSQDYVGTIQSDTVWLEDAAPSGASTVGTWNFVSTDPDPYSGTLAHQEALAAGSHQHYFYGATNTLSVGTDDALFTYVYLDPANPPTEVMLQWYADSSWEHRAYWGANKLQWGTDGSASRYYMGPLPPAGGWVRLEVPASLVGLAGKTVSGMAFSLYDGRATWDYAGRSAAPLPSQVQFSTGSYTTSEALGLATLTVTRGGNTSMPASVDYATADGTATGGADYTATSGTLSFNAWETSKTITIPILDDATAESNETLAVTLSNAVDATIGSTGTATVTIADNDYSISGQVTLDGAPLSGISFTASNGGSCTSTDATGLYRCTVSAGWSGTITPSYAGYWFNAAERSYTNVSANASGQDYLASVQQTETVWLDDAVPAGATTVGSWLLTSTDPVPLSGSLANQDPPADGVHQHYFYGATNTLTVGTGDILFAYVYLDPANPPTEVMLQWREGGSWEHRAYWGANQIPWGTDGTASHAYMGALPDAGGWYRLQVPASVVGLEGKTLNGLAFSLYGGKAAWDYAGKQ